MKKCLLLSLLTLTAFISQAQYFSKDELSLMRNHEDSLNTNALKITNGINSFDRFLADSLFTKILVRTLKTKNSFYYPFDSLQNISKLYAPDSSFRIFTWQLVIDENIIRQHGAIQMRTNDGSLKLIPLIDRSDNTINICDTIVNNKAWMGAIYYKIILNKNKDEKIYTFLGYDEYNIRCNRKFIEVMHFENGEPIFGGDYFDFSKDSSMPPIISRYVMEYKKDAGPRLTYDNDMNMIIMEHLVSESNEPKKKWTLVGDGDYEGFKWVDGKWSYITKVFNTVTPLGKAPTPLPILDNQTDENSKKPSHKKN